MAKQWHEEIYKLPKNTAWKAAPDCKIFVADRGAVRFDYPHSWIVKPVDNAIAFYDAEPPGDNCRLQVTVFQMPPDIDWTGLPLETMADEILLQEEGRRDATLHRAGRLDLEAIWIEFDWTDETCGRPAHSWQCLARGGNVQVLMTFDCWADEIEERLPVWQTVLKTLQLGQYIKDPLRHVAH